MPGVVAAADCVSRSETTTVMPRILLVCEYASLNGGERSLLAMLDELLNKLRGAEFEFIAAAPARGPLAAEFTRRGIGVQAFGADDDAEHDGAASQSARREQLAEIARRVQPGLLHANSLAMSRLSGPVAAAEGVPSIGHLRDIVRISRRAVDDLNRHTRLLAVSQSTGDFHVAAGLSAEKTRVLYNGVDLARFRPQPPSGYLHAELGLPRSAQLVGSIGQLGVRKGLDVLLAAAAMAVRRCTDAHFVLVGRRHSQKAESVAFERSLHALAGSPPLEGRVHFLGERGDVPRLICELALLAHAARQEPLGRVLLEAAACGKAVVATEAGGTAEIFPHAEMARLVPVDCAERFAAAMTHLLEDEPARAAVGRAARRRAEQAFDVRDAASGLAAHYREVAAGRGNS
jgi:glycosyltransferase involved in cell wall biosynthesis